MWDGHEHYFVTLTLDAYAAVHEQIPTDAVRPKRAASGVPTDMDTHHPDGESMSGAEWLALGISAAILTTIVVTLWKIAQS